MKGLDPSCLAPKCSRLIFQTSSKCPSQGDGFHLHYFHSSMPLRSLLPWQLARRSKQSIIYRRLLMQVHVGFIRFIQVLCTYLHVFIGFVQVLQCYRSLPYDLLYRCSQGLHIFSQALFTCHAVVQGFIRFSLRIGFVHVLHSFFTGFSNLSCSQPPLLLARRSN